MDINDLAKITDDLWGAVNSMRTELNQIAISMGELRGQITNTRWVTGVLGLLLTILLLFKELAK